MVFVGRLCVEGDAWPWEVGAEEASGIGIVAVESVLVGTL